MTVITVKVSNEERTLKEKHLLIYEKTSEYKEDPILNEFVKRAVESFGEPVDDVTVNINIPW